MQCVWICCVVIRRAESTEEEAIYTCAMDEDTAAPVGVPGTRPWTALTSHLCHLVRVGAWARPREAREVECGRGRSRGRAQAIGGETIRWPGQVANI